MRLYDLNTSASVKRNYIPGGGGWGFPGSSDGKESACKAGDLETPLSGRALEEEMAAHSRILAWRIPWTEETGRLQALGLQRVWHGWATNTTHYFLKILCSKATNHTITQMKTYTVLFLVCKALFSLLCSPIFCPCFKAQLKTHLSWKLSHHSLANASFLSWFIAWSICCLSHPLAHAILVAI